MSEKTLVIPDDPLPDDPALAPSPAVPMSYSRARALIRDTILECDAEVLDRVSGRAVNEITHRLVTALVAEGVIDNSRDDELEEFLDKWKPELRDDLRESIRKAGGLESWVALVMRTYRSPTE